MKWISEHRLFHGAGRILLAVSGGADSMAMLHCLLQLREQGAIGIEFVVGHVNHRLRGSAADGDERFVQEYAAGLGLEVLSCSADVPAYARDRKLSTETAGRMLRIRMLSEMARQCGATAAATAHHGDDQAETLVFRLKRGTGFRGLCGIRPTGELEGMTFVRPMLGVRREDILAYCQSEKLAWRQDHTNADIGISRNRVRHRLLPFLQTQAKADIAEPLMTLSKKCQSLFERIDTEVAKNLPEAIQSERPNQIVLKKSALAECSLFVLAEILRRCLEQLDVGLRDYTVRHYQKMMQRIHHSSRVKFRLPGNVDFNADDQFLIFHKNSDENLFPDEPVRLEIGKVCRFGPFQITTDLIEPDPDSFMQFQKEKNNRVERLDADKIKGPIRIRARKQGDRFRPLGMKTEKKVGKFLTAVKVSPEIRDNIFIVEDSEKILWTAPIRISDSVKVSPSTGRILRIQIDCLKSSL